MLFRSFFVNRRYITSRTIIAALENAYKNQIMIGKFPMAILNIEINPSLIDINVHPTKLEVKFSDEKAVYNAVYYGVKNALYEIPNVPKIERASEEFKRDTPKGQLNLSDLAVALPKTMTKRPETTAYNPRENHFLKNSGDTKNDLVSDSKTDKVGDTKTQNDFVSLKPDFIKPRQSEIPYTRTVSLETPKAETNGILPKKEAVKTEEATVEEIKKEEKTVTETVRVETVKEEKPTEQNVETEVQKREETVFADEYFEIVGQVFDSYIIAEKGDEMMIIDQHAAHERLKYEELKKDIASKQVVSQMLIEPVIVNLTGSEMTAYRDNKQLFDDIGFESEEFGDDAVIVRSVPGEVELGEVEPLVLELVAQGEELRKELITEKNERLLYTIACKSAVKANMRMSKIEMETLVRNVLRLKNINTCPHGRPIIVTMSKKELEKEFKRIV